MRGRNELEGRCQMIDLNVEKYLRQHEERAQRLKELDEKINSPQYSNEEKESFRKESLKLCLEGLATV
jgi:chaperonin cofactor prefoldin